MPNLIMLVGVAGSGKSTYAKRHLDDNTVWLSSDAIREELYGDESVQTNPKRVFEILNARTILALMDGYNVIYDATNLNAKRRMEFLQLLSGIPSVLKTVMVVQASRYTIDEHQAKRERKVPDAVIEKQMRQLQLPTKAEGWDEIIILCND